MAVYPKQNYKQKIISLNACLYPPNQDRTKVPFEDLAYTTQVLQALHKHFVFSRCEKGEMMNGKGGRTMNALSDQGQRCILGLSYLMLKRNKLWWCCSVFLKLLVEAGRECRSQPAQCLKLHRNWAEMMFLLLGKGNSYSHISTLAQLYT